MISDELQMIINELNIQGKMIFLDATTDNNIKTFESENDITLPSKYKEWLQFSDGGEFFLPAGIQLYGIEHKPVINVNDDTRPNDDFIVIGALASGDPILFKKNSESIAIYNLEAGKIEEDEIYNNFIDFIKDLYHLLGIGG